MPDSSTLTPRSQNSDPARVGGSLYALTDSHGKCCSLTHSLTCSTCSTNSSRVAPTPRLSFSLNGHLCLKHLLLSLTPWSRHDPQQSPRHCYEVSTLTLPTQHSSMTSRNQPSSMLTVTAPPFHFPTMPSTPSHGYTSAHHDSAPAPSQPSPSQRLLSQMLPAQPPPAPSQHTTPLRPPSTPQSAAIAASSSSLSSAQSALSHPHPNHINASPSRSGFRLSHPPPLPSSSSSSRNHVTPQSKRARIDTDTTGLSASLTSPLSNSNLNGSSATSAPLSSPSLSNAKPLSGIARPLPLPPTPSPSQRPPRPNDYNTPLIPMPQRSIHDFEKLLPQLHPPHIAMNAPQRALLQAIPPQPVLAVLDRHSPAAPHDIPPPPPPVGLLPSRHEWLASGFQSFDLDLERIAEVHRLEEERLRSTSQDEVPAESSGQGTRNAQLGHVELGLPSGSILEVLGPPGSGKSSLIVQFAITERLRSLHRVRAILTYPQAETTLELESGASAAAQNQSPVIDADAFFSEDFWDAEVAGADQVLMIDCEGALTPEKIADAAWSAVISLWHSSRQQQDHSGSAKSGTSTKQRREDMPEVVRRLVAAVLAGIRVSRVTSLAGLVALLHSLRPTDEWQDGQLKASLPSAMPPRTSLVLIDSLSYHTRLSGGTSQDRKIALQLNERIRDMLLRLQKPFEYRPKPNLSAEEQEAAKQRCAEATSTLCVPTIVFTNQLSIRRDRAERGGSGRSSPAGRPSNRNADRGEGFSTLGPLLNGPRPPQLARSREERPPPSVALCGPEMWEDDQQEMTATPRQVQQLRGGRGGAVQPMGHDRGWPPSYLGQDVWRMLLFRHGTFGQRFAQMVSVPPAVQGELSSLWGRTRDRLRAANATGRTEINQAGEASSSSTAPSDAQKRDEKMRELLSQLRASLFRWRPFNVTSQGLVSQQ